MSAWKRPPRIKVHEALGSVADGRIDVHGESAAVTSSSGGKVYEVVFDPAAKTISANDNGSYWQGYLGYPAIAFLLATGRVSHDPAVAAALKGIAWKDVNVRFKNDWEKTEAHVRGIAAARGLEAVALDAEVDRILAAAMALGLERGPRKKPPEGY
jgi:hypothetical protein